MKEYDVKFDAWWALAVEASRGGVMDLTGTSPADWARNAIDVHGYFDDGMTPEEFVAELARAAAAER